MPRLAAALTGAALVSAFGFASLTAQPQTRSTRWEYLRLSQESQFNPNRPVVRTCMATGDDWQCRDTESESVSNLSGTHYDTDAALSRALAAAGAGGWELVSVLPGADTNPTAATYLFKRSEP